MNFFYRTSTSLLGKRLCRKELLRHLNLQEYQCKQLLRQNGCTVQNFFVIDHAQSSEEDRIRNSAFAEYVVKAQILAGGRGRGSFIGSQAKRGGVRITKDVHEANSHVMDMLGKRLVTAQTDSNGVLVKKVMVAESVTIKRETYLSIVLDPTYMGPVIVASPSGGMDIEEIAQNHSELLLKENISVDLGITEEQCLKIAKFLKFKDKLMGDAIEQIRRLYEMFIKTDATLLEINPFAETEDNRVFCIDAKLNFDDNAHFRQRQIFDMDNLDEMDFRETLAKKNGLSYVGLDGNIACMVNGAGLAMATMDIIKLHGGEPANFLDLGGGASIEQVKEAFKILTINASNIRVIFINVFAGILRCDIVAQGILEATVESKLNIPLVIRLKGTRVAEAKQLIDGSSHLGIFECYDSFEEAAKRAVQLSTLSNLDKCKELEEKCAGLRHC